MWMLWRLVIAASLPASMAVARPPNIGVLQATATVVHGFASAEMALPKQAGLVIRASDDAAVIVDRGMELAYDHARNVYVATSPDGAETGYVTVIYP